MKAMEVNADIANPLIALVGIIIGVGLQYKFGIIAESSKQYQNLKSQAYVDFIKSVAGRTIAQRQQDIQGESSFLTLMIDAKIRIAIYGCKEVAELIAKFFRMHGSFNSPEAHRSFVNIIQKMRAESADGRKLPLNDDDISQLLFDSDLQCQGI
jgi:hypothetical protein